MNESEHDMLVELMFDGATRGVVDLDRLPAEPISRAQGLEVQIGVLNRLQEAGATLGGWKVGLTSGPGRDSMGAGYRPPGYILHERIHASGVVLQPHECAIQQVEVEMCVDIGMDLRGRGLPTAQIADAIKGIRPAFELNQLRLPTTVDFGITIADNLAQWGIVVGTLSPWTPTPALNVSLTRDGRTVAEVNSQGVAIDPPLLAIKRLLHRLADVDLGLEEGQKVITGALVKVPAAAGAWRAEVGHLGAVEFTLTGT